MLERKHTNSACGQQVLNTTGFVSNTIKQTVLHVGSTKGLPKNTRILNNAMLNKSKEVQN